ncbi:hypothetical protein RchiOBHm_Chr7g0239021 [Rosa chinensis]|uniref:Uncharacterized protein n=1 Tax=Rosa chinensis TaxID=74649 RepID=A0A2P6PHM0_ROSCH|nr:uncharacterized protein LOC112179605 [Rosa chinensis]PRQ21417.1 hypothetical protein RchiOBHm_Chr7g0239021 [Rosa chinensis]
MEAETQTLTEAEALQSRNAIRSIKVALLLSRLKPSSVDRRLTDHRGAATEKEEALRREIGDLKMEVVRERLRNKRIRLCGLMELFLEVAVLFVLCGLLFAIAVGGDGGSSELRY